MGTEFKQGEILSMEIEDQKIYFVARNDHELYLQKEGYAITEIKQNDKKEKQIITAFGIDPENTPQHTGAYIFSDRIYVNDGNDEFQKIGSLPDETIRKIREYDHKLQECNLIEYKSLTVCKEDISKEIKLYNAIWENDEFTVDALLQKGMDPNGQSLKGDTPLIYASVMEADRAADALLRNGAYVNPIDDGGKKPLEISAKKGDYDTTRVLLMHHADTTNLEMQDLLPEIQELVKAHSKNIKHNTPDRLETIQLSPVQDTEGLSIRRDRR